MILKFDDVALRFKDYTDVKARSAVRFSPADFRKWHEVCMKPTLTPTENFFLGAIYGPSYLSFDYALSAYSLIPENVYNTYTCATFHKGKVKKYENAFGLFLYRDVPDAAYNLGVDIKEQNGYSYQIAAPEKALCDKLYSLTPVKTLRDLRTLMFEDLRIDESVFWMLNLDDIRQLAPLYKSTNLKLLAKLVKGGK